MKKHYFYRPQGIQCPLDSHIDNFKSLLVEQGYTKATIKYKLLLVSKLSCWMLQQRLSVADLDELLVTKFIKHKDKQFSTHQGDVTTLRTLLVQLRANGMVPTPATKDDDSELAVLIRDFKHYLLCERGLSKASLSNYVSTMQGFICQRFASKPIQLDKITPTDISRYILSCTKKYSRKRCQLIVTALRSLFRYLRLRGQIAIDLAAAVPSVANWRLAGIPKFLPTDQVESLLKSCDQNSKTGQRDYTVLLLLARLGLRAGEIVAMTLDDINWDTGELLIRGKGPRKDSLPIPHEVGKALATYLQHTRPSCSSRKVFIRMRAPHIGFSSSVAVSNLVERAIIRAHLELPYKGAHLLRHSLATRMLGNGASLSEIGDILRHCSPNTTEIYAKVDMASLGSLAQPWPGGEK